MTKKYKLDEGKIGLIFLITSYIMLLYKELYFLILNIIAAILLLIYSKKKKDNIFIFVNAWILVFLIIKLFIKIL